MKQLQHLPLLLLLVLLVLGAGAPPPACAYTPDEVSQLVAPIALYPDALLSNVLAAATYPDEVGQAQQWVQQYGPLQPGQVDSALAAVNWDASVKSLTAFPSVLNYMAANMAWTEALGNAFLTQPDDVDAAIQNLRMAAQQNGALQSNAQVLVTDVNGAIVIEAGDPQYLYVPSYDFGTVYYPGWSPIVWGPGIAVGDYLWLGVFDWRYHHMYFGRGYNYYYRGHLAANNPNYQRVFGDVSRHTGAWQFNQVHRRGRPVPSISQLNQGRGFTTPANNFARPGPRIGTGTSIRPSGPALNPGRPGAGQAPRLEPTFSTPRSAPPVFNVRPGATVNIERGQGAESRHVNIPAPVRPFSPPTMSRPTFQRSVPMPRPAPMQRSAPQAPRSQPQRGGRR